MRYNHADGTRLYLILYILYLNSVHFYFRGYPFGFIAQRMRVAMNQLSHTALPVSEIALSVGYENQNFFYKQFKKMYDMTPNEARLKSRQ